MSKYTRLINKVTGEKSIRINKTGETVSEKLNPELYADLRKKSIAADKRQAVKDIYESCGLTRVRGAVSGKTYWE